MKPPLIFLKLGGSLLSDKRRQRSFRAAAVKRLGGEIRRAMESGGFRLLLGHGAGCFGHYPAKQYRTRAGLPGGGGWRGFAETRRGVIEMNRRVLDALAQGGLRPVLVPPVASVTARRGRVSRWDTSVLRALLEAGQIPLIHGDVVLDADLGFTILSTEELFLHLAAELRPQRIILACDVPGVFCDAVGPAARRTVIPCIDASNIRRVRRALTSGAPGAHDVTGGMASKVERLCEMAQRMPGLESVIVSGLASGAVEAALRGEAVGTRINGRRPLRKRLKS